MNNEVITPEIIEPSKQNYFSKVKSKVNQELKEKPITFNLKQINDNKKYYNTYNNTNNQVNTTKKGFFSLFFQFILFIILLPFKIVKGIWNYLNLKYDLSKKIKIERAKEKFLKFKTKVNKKGLYCDEVL